MENHSQISNMALLRISFFLGLLSTFVAYSSCIDDSVVVPTHLGDIVGKRINIQEKQVNQFLGIPFAKPLTKENRFKRAKSIDKYESPIVADKMPSDCPQAASKMSKIMGTNVKTINENCLFLNIWSPVTDSEDKTPKEVMFWIYGGGFQMGSINLPFYNGAILSSFGDVVIVAANYRIGSFGFFTSDGDDEPANNGLYDQNLALHWVQENIAFFGGDPSKVTLFGQSAGSMSITHHISSPFSKGLFNKVILQSGARLSTFFTADRELLIDTSLELARKVNCAVNDENFKTHHDKIMNCLRNKEIRDILNAEVKLPQNSFLPLMGEDFIPINDRHVTDNFKGDILIGLMEEEGNLMLLFLEEDFQNPKKMMKKKQAMTYISQMVRRHLKDPEMLIAPYFEDIDENDVLAVRAAFSEIISDMCFVCPALLYADGYAKEGGNVYFYLFTHFSPKPSPLPNWMRATHALDIAYWFGMPANPALNYPKIDSDFSKEMMKVLTDFAKGKNPEWELYTPNSYKAQELNPTRNSPIEIPRAKLCYKLWKPALEGQLNVRDKSEDTEIKTEL